MKEISVETIKNEVSALCSSANYDLPSDILDGLQNAASSEVSPLGKEVLSQIIQNSKIASKNGIALCQDCGVAVFFIEVGQDVHIVGGSLVDAINEGVRDGYQSGYLRTSMAHGLLEDRRNTGDNTPAVIHTEICPGDHLKITMMAKGAGSENMSRMAILLPSVGRKGIVEFILETVELAGGKACPPIVLGVGIGGNFELAPYLAKKSLLRELGEPNPNPQIASLESELLAEVNKLGIGPMGYGGINTALAVHVEEYPSHIASLPVAVNIQCHSARHKSVTL